MDRLIKIALNIFPRKYLIRLSYLFRWFTQFTNRGTDVECPVCGSEYKKFLSYGYKVTRKNALCPKCLSLERHRLVWLYLQNKTQLFEAPTKLLHVAPEQPFEERFRKLTNIDYLTADIESPLADCKCDVQEMPFEEDSFDMVICNHVLEHVNDDSRAMSEILRVLKPGGMAILLVPMDFKLEETYEDPTITSPKERAKHFHQYDHLRLYGLDFPDKLKKVGFQIPPLNYLDELSEEQKQHYGLMVNELMYGYTKPTENNLNSNKK